MSIRQLTFAVTLCAACHTDARVSPPAALESRGEITMGGMTGTLESIDDLATGRHRMTVHVGDTVIGDGDDGSPWELTAGGEVVRADTPEAIALAATARWLNRRDYLAHAGATYRELGERTDAGQRYRVVEAVPAGGATVELWFAGDTLARTEVRDGKVTEVTRLRDYRDIAGVQVPFEVVVDRGDPRDRVTIHLTACQPRAQVADAMFAAPNQDDRLALAGPSELPFELINNHIYVRGAVDGVPVRMLFDTGGLNVLTPAAAARIGLAATGKLAGNGVGSERVDVAIAHAKSLVIGGARLAEPVFYVLDFGTLAAVEGEEFDGIVGFELFQRLVVRVDYPARKLTMSRPAGFVAPAGAVAVPFELRERTPIIAGEIDGLAAQFSVDTGSRSSLSAMGPFVRAHELEKRYHPAFETVTGWGVGGGVRAKPVRFARIKLGTVAVEDVAGELFTGDKGALGDPDLAGNLGAGVLRRFVVTFDYAARKIFFEGTGAGHDVYDRAGIFLLAAGDALRVVAVTPGGPAEHAGLAADDRILAIDGAPIATRHLADWRTVLTEGDVGARHVLAVESHGTRRDRTITLAEQLP